MIYFKLPTEEKKHERVKEILQRFAHSQGFRWPNCGDAHGLLNFDFNYIFFYEDGKKIYQSDRPGSNGGELYTDLTKVMSWLINPIPLKPNLMVGTHEVVRLNKFQFKIGCKTFQVDLFEKLVNMLNDLPVYVHSLFISDENITVTSEKLKEIFKYLEDTDTQSTKKEDMFE